jgi:hypothetical protein
MKKAMNKASLIVISFLLISCSCKNTKEETNNSISNDKNTSVVLIDSLAKIGIISLDELAATPDKYIGKTIEIEGIFLGYSGTNCSFDEKFSMQLTRSDWILGNDENCIYVTGGAPTGLNPMDAADKGKKTKISCLVKLTGSKKIILEYKKTIN